MKIEIQKSGERGSGEYGWLHTKYSFSFAGYYNPEKVGFGALCVLNDDVVEPGRGFGMHSHDNMEIVTIVLDGVLEHKDSLGNRGTIPAGYIQCMSAGRGITHSEFNHSNKSPVSLLQIWIHTKEREIKPGYRQMLLSKVDRKNKLATVASGRREPGALYIHQDAVLLLGSLDKGTKISHRLDGKKHGAYVFLIDGEISVGGMALQKRDAASITETGSIEIAATKNSEILLIEVPAKWKEL